MRSTLNIALIGEGRNDVGVMGEKEWKEGTVQEYLRRILGEEFELRFEVLAVSKRETRNIKVGKSGRYRKSPLRGVAKKLFRFLQLHGKRNDFNLLVFFSDTDKTQGQRASEREAIDRYSNILDNIKDGQQFLKKKMPNLSFIPMIPIRILECWLLGDKVGFDNLECSPQNPILPNTPEFIWGDKKNPESNYPKHYLKRVLENGGLENTTLYYNLIIANNDLENLCRNCPNSFKPFYDDMIAYKTTLLEQ